MHKCNLGELIGDESYSRSYNGLWVYIVVCSIVGLILMSPTYDEIKLLTIAT